VRVRDFDFELPAERIAQRPRPRGSSRLLVLDAAGEDRHRTVRDLPALLRPGDLLVVNDTRVLRARLFARRLPGGAEVELLLAERHDDRRWDCLVRPGRRARVGSRLELRAAAGGAGVTAEVVGEGEDGRRRLEFSAPVEPLLDRIGHVPLPPYVDRPDDAEDAERYQTIWARAPGAIAAPTAGLHFDDALLAALGARGIERAAVTLHVGIGTFKPVTAELVHEHRMDAERYDVPSATAAAIARVRRDGGRIVAVGTTVVRALESAGLGAAPGEVAAGAGRSELFVVPGFEFRVVDVLLTNFPLPRSTLLMLVSAFAGRERVLDAYREAVAAGYDFYSYGDALLARRRPTDG
jgi:S-adenosylmethionine:tRNA ribosyltransferase-isomerase